jgi:hypothetical protein
MPPESMIHTKSTQESIDNTLRPNFTAHSSSATPPTPSQTPYDPPHSSQDTSLPYFLISQRTQLKEEEKNVPEGLDFLVSSFIVEEEHLGVGDACLFVD